jgi:hypothetical protein
VASGRFDPTAYYPRLGVQWLGRVPLLKTRLHFQWEAMMDFLIKERYLMLSILPTEGDFRTMRTIQELRTSLLFNSDEVIKSKIAQEGNTLTWDVTKDEPGSDRYGAQGIGRRQEDHSGLHAAL